MKKRIIAVFEMNEPTDSGRALTKLRKLTYDDPERIKSAMFFEVVSDDPSLWKGSALLELLKQETIFLGDATN